VCFDYPAVGDGFNALSGVAPNCKWFGAKVFTDDGLGNSMDTGAAIDDLVAMRVDENVKIVNLSLTAIGGSDAGLRAKANSAVDTACWWSSLRATGVQIQWSPIRG